MALKQLERSIQLHRRALLEFQQWLEAALQQFQRTLENIITVEKLIDHARPGEKYHKLAALLMAVQCARVSQFFKELYARQDTPGVDACPNDDPFSVLNMLIAPLSAASRDYLKLNDHSMVAQGKDEYASMSDKDRAELQCQHHDRILNFFNSCQEEHFTPSPVIIECIMKKIVNVDKRYSKLRKRYRGSYVVSEIVPSRSGKSGHISQDDELYWQCRGLATEHACLFELIDDNTQFLKCFYVGVEKEIEIKSANHQEPSKLVTHLLDKVWDVTWEYFSFEMSVVEANERFVRGFSAHPSLLPGCEGDMEEVKERYNNLKENKRLYVEQVLNACHGKAQKIVKHFNSACSSCTHSTPQKLFHLVMKESSVPKIFVS